jgi:hypothetical protein
VKLNIGNLRPTSAPPPSAYSFVGASGGLQGASGAIPIPFPSGTAAGDLVFVYISNNGAGGTVSTSGWTQATFSSGSGADVWWKIVNATDIATATASVTSASPNNTLYALAFRGFASASVLSNQGVGSNDSTSSRSWSGATKGGSCHGLLFLMDGNSSTAFTITSPAMASGAYYPGGSNSSGLYKVRAFYDFTVSEYTSGTAIDETYGAFWDQIDIAVFEMV